jgi:KipI family sensor histidine kinase inhibitor
VCYQYSGKNHPNDMPLVEQYSGLSANEIIQIHQNTRYQVFAIGFMPNFAYLGELSPALSVPRLKEPRLKVPAGAVAITDNQTAVYPNESPGGWHIIGYTNFRFSDGLNSVIGPNDNVSFKAVNLSAFLRETKRSSDRYV